MPISIEKFMTQDLRHKVVIFETDTVYGIGCLYDDLDSVKRLFEIKNREYQKPMAILCADMRQVKQLVTNFEAIAPYAKKYGPGALTLICQKSGKVADLITAGGATVGIRIPDHDISLRILHHFGPMVVTSLNQSSEPAILKYADALKYENTVDFIVEGHDLSQLASTVYDPTTHLTLRQGKIVVTEL
jgi:L-threonylcarbamoyladenylate synthase